MQGIYSSGSRIKMRVGTTPDGAKQFNGWYDSQLGFNCSFTLAADGQNRCLPAVTTYYFADSLCSVPLAYSIAEPCGTYPAPNYVGVATPLNAMCSLGTKVYPVTSTQYTGMVFQHTPYAAGCPQVTLNGTTFYSVGAEVSASTFQSMTEQIQ